MTSLKIIKWLFFFGLFLLFLLPPFDPDLGWQLRCGQLFWQESSFCQQNQFTVLLENYSWPNHHWLYQAAIFPLFQAFGLWGLTITNGLLMSLAFFLFYLAIKNYPWEKMVTIGLIIFLGWGVFRLGLRSQLVGFFLFNLLFWLNSKIPKKPRLIFLFPLVTLVWANSHGSVILGLILLGFLGLKMTIVRPKRWLFFSLILLVSFLITLLNPFGFGIYQEAWRHFAGVKLATLIAEWVPPNPLFWWPIFLSGWVFFFYFLFGKTTQEKVGAFLLIPFAFLALKARRNTPFFYLLTLLLFLTTARTQKFLKPWLKKKELRNNLAIITAIIFLFIGLFIRPALTFSSIRSWPDYCQKSPLNYPYQAVEFLKGQPVKGNLFNRYEWGGFLIWQLPEYKIFVDGRMPAWPTSSGKSPYTIYLETLQTQPGWGATLTEYNLNWILISPGTFMDLKLRPDPQKFGWGEVYRDKVSVVYKRK